MWTYRHQHVLAQQVLQRIQKFAERTAAAPQRGPAQLHALASVEFGLTVIRRQLILPTGANYSGRIHCYAALVAALPALRM